MSLDDRIRRGLHQAIEPLTARDEAVQAALVQTKTVTVPRQRRRVVALAATAVALVVALGVSQSLGRLLLSVERRLPPAEEDQENERTDESEEIERAIDERGGVQEGISSGSPTSTSKSKGQEVETPTAGPGSVPTSGGGKDESRAPDLKQEKGYVYREGLSEAAACWASGQTCDYAVEFQAAKAYRFVSIDILDSSGRDVVANVYLDRDGDGEVESEGKQICTSTSAPLKIERGSKVLVIIAGAGCDTPAYARGPTSGKVVATFRSSS